MQGDNRVTPAPNTPFPQLSRGNSFFPSARRLGAKVFFRIDQGAIRFCCLRVASALQRP